MRITVAITLTSRTSGNVQRGEVGPEDLRVVALSFVCSACTIPVHIFLINAFISCACTGSVLCWCYVLSLGIRMRQQLRSTGTRHIISCSEVVVLCTVYDPATFLIKNHDM